MAVKRNRTGMHWAGIGLALLLAGCSTGGGPQVAAVDVTPVASQPAIAEAPPPDARQYAAAQLIWALRGGLNVAALLCNDRVLVADYNKLLKVHRGLLADAYAAEQGRFRQMHGTAWQARHDAAMTRLYNGFSNVTDRRRYCGQAALIARDVVAMPSSELAVTAQRALHALDPDAPRLLRTAN